MKKLTLKLILPLTIISFIIFTKWWYVLVVDRRDEIMYGFPLIFTCRGFHASLSSQVFIVEFMIDLLVYFLFWFMLVYMANRFLFTIKLHKALFIPLVTVTFISLGFAIFIASKLENQFFLKRDFEIEKMKTGYNLIWQKQIRPDYPKSYSGQ
ncbi:MAG TPA: hypothetical protein VFU29_01455 [Chitinophagaceae bacterium]|nr:hypothetical protein [Chitinophagaceae bacterium]